MDFFEARSALNGDLSRLRDTVRLLAAHVRSELKLADFATSIESAVAAIARVVAEVLDLPAKEASVRCERVAFDARQLAAQIEQVMENVVGSTINTRFVGVDSPIEFRRSIRGAWTDFRAAMSRVIPQLREGFSQVIPLLRECVSQTLSNAIMPQEPKKTSGLRPPDVSREPTAPVTTAETGIPERWLCSKCHYHLTGLVERQRCQACRKLGLVGSACEHCGGKLALLHWVICPECGTEIALKVRNTSSVMKAAYEAALALAAMADKVRVAAKAETKM